MADVMTLGQRMLMRAAQKGAANPEPISNKEYRSKEHAKPESFTVKLVTQPAFMGVQGPVVTDSGLSKSATRFGIDQNLITLNKIESSPGANSGKEAVVYTAEVSAETAMALLDAFDKNIGQNADELYLSQYNNYIEKRDTLYRTYLIRKSPDHKVIWPSTEVQKAVLDELRKYSFACANMYLSVSAKGTRATRSKTFKCLAADALDYAQYSLEVLKPICSAFALREAKHA